MLLVRAPLTFTGRYVYVDVHYNPNAETASWIGLKKKEKSVYNACLEDL